MKPQYKLNALSNITFEVLQNIITLFKDSDSCIHKARNIIKIIPLNNTNFVVKSFKIPHLLNKIVYTFFRDSKAKKSYDNTLKIEPFAPKAIGYIEFKKFGLLDESYFVSEHFEYDFTIREPLLDPKFQGREILLSEFARFSYEMHQKGIFHNDYSPGNILIKKDGTQYIFKVVDVNRMKFFSLSPEDRARNFSQLWADDKDLEIIIDKYKKYYKTDQDLQKLTLEFSHQHKKKKNFKKRLKGKKIDA